MKKQILFSMLFGASLLPGLAQASVDIPVSTLYGVNGDGAMLATIVNEPMPVAVTTASSLKTPGIFDVSSAKETFRSIEKNALGISQKDFERFSIEAPSRLDGQIVLNVDDLGKAYIVDATKNNLIYLGAPEMAFKAFQKYTKNEVTITDRTWIWQKTVMNNDEVSTPKQVDVFSLTFFADGKVNGSTDCNNFFGTYERDGDNISFGPFGSTRMFCEGSQELDFTSSLAEAESLLFTDEGNLVLTLKMDSGSMMFQ